MTDVPLHSVHFIPACAMCGQPMYRHPIVIWALQCLRCDRPPRKGR
jgi:hypothetical protein